MSFSKSRACGKVRFRDHKEAVGILHRIKNKRQWAELVGVETRRREVRCYDCDRCQGVHLTSQP